MIYLEDDPTKIIGLFTEQAGEVMQIMPSAAPFLAEVSKHLVADQYHHAIKAGRELIVHEQKWLEDRCRRTNAA